MAEEEPNSDFSRERFVNAINASKEKLNQKILDRQEREAKIDKASKPVANVANDEQSLKKSTRSGEQYSTSHVISEGDNNMEDSFKKDIPITIPEMVSRISTKSQLCEKGLKNDTSLKSHMEISHNTLEVKSENPNIQPSCHGCALSNNLADPQPPLAKAIRGK